MRRPRRNPSPMDPIPRIVRVSGWRPRWGRPHGYRGTPQMLKSKYVEYRVYVADRWHETTRTLAAAKRVMARMTPATIARVLGKAPTEPADTHPWEVYDRGSASGKVVAWWQGPPGGE